MSYAILIVNDAMRLVASQLRLEDLPGLLWWTFLVAVYVPASIALAWPLARVLGLFPRPVSPELESGIAHTEVPIRLPAPAEVGLA